MEGYLKSHLNRRNFLKVMAVLGLELVVPPAFAIPLSNVKFDKKLFKLEKTLPLMGTFVTITVLDPSADKAQEAIEAGLSKTKELNNIFNRFNPNTQVSELNKKRILKDISPHLCEVFKKSNYYYRLSQGSFDVTIKPLVDLFKKTFAFKGSPPSLAKIKETLSLVGANMIYCSSKEIKLKEGMGVSFDGIAKGYIVDKTAETIKNMGINYALINAGGDIRAIGEKNWQIGIKDPFNKGDYIELINLKDNAIATSGNYEIYFDRKRLYHHIIDPKIGYSPGFSCSVSIVAPNAVDADALSTTAFVLKPLQGKRFIEGLPNTKGLIITKQEAKLQTNNWRSLL
jgi:thiamine biosynthesis lipoprotein